MRSSKRKASYTGMFPGIENPIRIKISVEEARHYIGLLEFADAEPERFSRTFWRCILMPAVQKHSPKASIKSAKNIESKKKKILSALFWLYYKHTKRGLPLYDAFSRLDDVFRKMQCIYEDEKTFFDPYGEKDMCSFRSGYVSDGLNMLRNAVEKKDIAYLVLLLDDIEHKVNPSAMGGDLPFPCSVLMREDLLLAYSLVVAVCHECFGFFRLPTPARFATSLYRKHFFISRDVFLPVCNSKKAKL